MHMRSPIRVADSDNSSHSNFRPSMYSTSSISDFIHGDDGSPKIQNTSHRQRSGRKTWKSLKEKKEAVWPDYLEEALLEALERYRPTSSKDPRSLRRFPKRNAYISKYIKEKTNVSRTPKQVGSRLQQLRETCTEQRVIRLIVSRDFDAPDRVAAAQAPVPNAVSRTTPDLRTNACIPEYSPTSSNTTSAGLTTSLSMDSLHLDPYEYPVTPYFDDSEPRSIRLSPSAGGSWPHAYVHIDLTSEGHSYLRSSIEESTTFTLDLDESGLTDTPVLNGPEAWKWQCRMSVPTPTPICYHTPSVTFSSSILSPNVHYEALFRVQKDNKVIFTGSTELELVSETHCRPSLFRSSVLPKYWSSVSSHSSELHQYIIIQDIYESAASTDRRVVDPIYTVVFNFDCSIPPSEQGHASHEQQYITASGASAFPGSAVSCFSSPHPYECLPLSGDDRIRIPLAPIMTNTIHLNNASSSSVGDLLDYDGVGDYGALVPPIGGTAIAEPGATHGTLAWYASSTYMQTGSPTTIYCSTGMFNGGMQGGVEGEGYGYPNLYSF